MNIAQRNKLFETIMRAWHVDESSAESLFGEDQRDVRTESLQQIYRALHLLHNGELADEWIRLPNTGPIFQGKTPLEYMIDGGLGAILIVRKELLGRLQGHYS